MKTNWKKLDEQCFFKRRPAQFSKIYPARNRSLTKNRPYTFDTQAGLFSLITMGFFKSCPLLAVKHCRMEKTMLQAYKTITFSFQCHITIRLRRLPVATQSPCTAVLSGQQQAPFLDDRFYTVFGYPL